MYINGFYIQNAPTYAEQKKAIIGRVYDDEVWFYGAYDDIKKAYALAAQIENALVIINRNA